MVSLVSFPWRQPAVWPLRKIVVPYPDDGGCYGAFAERKFVTKEVSLRACQRLVYVRNNTKLR